MGMDVGVGASADEGVDTGADIGVKLRLGPEPLRTLQLSHGHEGGHKPSIVPDRGREVWLMVHRLAPHRPTGAAAGGTQRSAGVGSASAFGREFTVGVVVRSLHAEREEFYGQSLH